MAIISGVTEKPFTRGEHLRLLLGELLAAASFGTTLKRNKALVDFVDYSHGEIRVSETDLIKWLKVILPSSPGVLLNPPSPMARVEWKLRRCLKDLPCESQGYFGELLGKIVSGLNKNDGNWVFFAERLKPCYDNFLAGRNGK
jgi:hypothetical protein